MTIDIILTLVQGAAMAIAAAALLVTLSGIRRQLWLTTFSDYTKRYSDIMERVPMACRHHPETFGLAGLEAEERDDLLCLALRYLNLCSEEYYLHLEKIIDNRTWKMWEAEITMSVRRRWLVDAWAVVKAEYDSFPEFHSFVERVTEPSAEPSRAAALPNMS